jgi:hypothetical protein
MRMLRFSTPYRKTQQSKVFGENKGLRPHFCDCRSRERQKSMLISSAVAVANFSVALDPGR